MKAVVEPCPRLGVQNIPGFGLALLAALMGEGVLVGGMNLDGQVPRGVDELDEDGELGEGRSPPQR